MSPTRVRLNQLTPEQEATLPAIRDKWLAIGLSTAPAERARAEASMYRWDFGSVPAVLGR